MAVKPVLKEYFRKSGDTYLIKHNLHSNEFGFASWTIIPEEDVLLVCNVYGDGKYWDRFFRGLARALNLKKVRFATKRSPKAFCRRFGAKIVAYVLEVDINGDSTL